MTLTEVKNILTNEFTLYLLPERWHVKDNGDGLLLERNGESFKDFIYLNVKEHFDDDHLVKYHLVRPYAAKRFQKIEQILSSCFRYKDDEEMATIFPYGFYDGQMDDRLPKPLSGAVEEQEVIQHAKLMQEYIARYLISFFTKFSSLKEVDSKIQQTPIIDLHKFIGQEVVGRRMVIMKLAGNSNYEQYVTTILDYFTTESKKGNTEAMTDLRKYTKLADYLLNIHPES